MGPMDLGWCFFDPVNLAIPLFISLVGFGQACHDIFSVQEMECGAWVWERAFLILKKCTFAPFSVLTAAGSLR